MVLRATVIAIALAAGLVPVLAQVRGPVAAPRAPQPAAQNQGQPNAVQGFSMNREQPVHIEAIRLEVRDKEKIATFSGNVQVNQGDTEMRCKTLMVFYEGDAATGGGKGAAKTAATGSTRTATAATPGPGGEQRIKRLEARGDVIVTQKDQVATGDVALFDMKTNIVTMTGNVVLTQGQSVVRGERLMVDMATGYSRVESGKGGDGRVQGLFLPGSVKPPAPATAPAAAPKPAR